MLPVLVLAQGKYEWKKADPHVPADVLKHWLRDLFEPVIPMSMYNDALKASDSVEASLRFAFTLPKVNFDTLGERGDHCALA